MASVKGLQQEELSHALRHRRVRVVHRCMEPPTPIASALLAQQSHTFISLALILSFCLPPCQAATSARALGAFMVSGVEPNAENKLFVGGMPTE